MSAPADAATGAVPSGLRTLHLTPQEVWSAQKHLRFYYPEAFASDGFIHCTDDVNELMNVGNRYYRSDLRSYVVLTINCELLTAPAIYEDPDRLFPHIYGPLDTAAVERVQSVTRDTTGKFQAIQE
jgi:uncharacterized protein (DUF952 family)